MKRFLVACILAAAASPFAAAQDKNDPKKEKEPEPRPLDFWAKLDDADLVKALDGEGATDRQNVQKELIRRGGKLRPALLKLLKESDSSRARVAAVGVVQHFYDDGVKAALLDLLGQPDDDLRRLAADALGLKAKSGDKAVHEGLVAILNDEDRAVRRAVIMAVGKVGADGAADVLVNTLKFDDGKDAALSDGLLRAIELLGKRGIEKLLALTDTGDDGDLQKAVEAFYSLRTRPAAEALPTLLKNYHLSGEQKAKLLRTYLNYRLDPPLSADPIADYLAALPKIPRGEVPLKQAQELKELVPVRLAGLEVLSALEGGLKGKKAAALVEEALSDAGLRRDAVRALGAGAAGAAGAKLVAQRFLDGKLPVALRALVIEALGRHPKDADAVRLRKEVEKGRPET